MRGSPVQVRPGAFCFTLVNQGFFVLWRGKTVQKRAVFCSFGDYTFHASPVPFSAAFLSFLPRHILFPLPLRILFLLRPGIVLSNRLQFPLCLDIVCYRYLRKAKHMEVFISRWQSPASMTLLISEYYFPASVLLLSYRNTIGYKNTTGLLTGDINILHLIIARF